MGRRIFRSADRRDGGDSRPARPVASADALEPRRLLVGVAWDTAYGGSAGGRAVFDLADDGYSGDYVTDAAALPEGKVVIVANGSAPAGQSPQVQLVRLDAAGRRAPTFGRGGAAALRPGGTAASANAVAVLPDGRLLVGANRWTSGSLATTYADVVLSRHRPDGSIDLTFGPDATGKVVIRNAAVADVALLPDGKVLVAGTANPDGPDPGRSAPAVWRLNADGTADPTFGAAGRATPFPPNYTGAVHSLIVLPDGRFYGVGPGGWVGFRADGSVEVGPVRRADEDYGLARLVRQPDGKLVGVATHRDYSSNGVVVARWQPDGRPDETFGEGGSGKATVNWGSYDFAADLLVQPDGKLLVGAASGDDFALARLLPGGAPDPTFGVEGRLVQDLSDPAAPPPEWGGPPATRDQLARLVLAPGNRLIAVGNTTAPATPAEIVPAGSDDYNVAAVGYVLDAPLTADGGGPYGPVDEGGAFAVSADRSSYAPDRNSPLMTAAARARARIVRYEWDADYDGRRFTPDAEGITASLTAKDDDPAARVVLRVTTADGLQALSAPAPVRARNVAPTAEAWADRVGPAGGSAYEGSVSANIVITDPAGPGEQFTVTADWGDGTPLDTFYTRERTVARQHVYAATGTYGPVTFSVSDDDDGGVAPTVTAVNSVRVAPLVGTFHVEGPAAPAGTRPNKGVAVFIDLDHDGAPGPGEPLTRTDANGDFVFEALPPLAPDDNYYYSVRVVASAGWLADFAEFDNGADLVRVTPGHGARVNFGITRLAQISGLIFRDLDRDGVRGADEPIDQRGWAYLDLNDDGVYDSEAEPVSYPGYDAEGYLFRGLAPGTYTVRYFTPGNLAQTAPANGAGYRVTVGPAEAAVRDFGLAPGAAVEGVVFDDLDGDGSRDDGEPALSGRTVFADFDGDGRLDPGDEPADVTDAQGAYLVRRLPPGTWTLRQVLPGGWVQTLPDGNNGLAVTVQAGRSVSGQDFAARHASDHAPPAVESAVLSEDAGGRHRLDVRFSEDVGASLSLADFGFGTNSFFAQPIDPRTAALAYDPATRTAKVTFPGLPGGRLRVGEYFVRLPAGSVADAAGNPLAADVTAPLSVFPRVLGAWVNGRAWAPGFRAYLNANGLGDAAYGFRLEPTGAAPPTLPWTNLDRISVRLDAPPAFADWPTLTARGAAGQTYALGRPTQAEGAVYTWTFPSNLRADRITLDLALDARVAPARFYFDVLPGDANRDGVRPRVPGHAATIRVRARRTASPVRPGPSRPAPRPRSAR